MSEEDLTTTEKPTLEEIEEETRSEKPVQKKDSPLGQEKNPNRVKAGHKLAAIGQKAKEEKMRKKVEESMIKPKTWVSIGVVIGGICVGGLWLGMPLFGKKKVESLPDDRKPLSDDRKPTNKYFG